MSEYPKYMSDPYFYKYFGLEILVRTSTHPAGHALDEITANYEIFKDGVLRANAHVVNGHASAELARENAFRIAKQVVFETMDGPDPDSGSDGV